MARGLAGTRSREGILWGCEDEDEGEMEMDLRETGFPLGSG